MKLGQFNSRFKDFFDTWMLAQRFEFQGAALAAAIRGTFENRGTQLIDHPYPLTQEFAADPSRSKQWDAFLHRHQIGNIPADFTQIVESISKFLLPVVDTIVHNRHFSAVWLPAGPWQQIVP